MQTDEQRIQELVRQMHERAENASWELTPEDIRTHRRRRAMAIPDPKVVVLVAAAAVLVVIGFFVLRPTTHKTASTVNSTTTTTGVPGQVVVVPNVVGLMQAQAEMALGNAGLSVGAITGESGTQMPAGSVIASNPSAGASMAAHSTVDLTVSTGPPGGVGSSALLPSSTSTTQVPASASGPAPVPTTPATQSSCSPGNVSLTMTTESASICMRAGAQLTATFVSLGWWSGYGSWASAAPMISNGSVLSGVSYVPSGKTATAVFSAVGPGTSTVQAQFDVTCAPSDTTPCTVPPGAWETLTVTVDPA